MRTQFAPLWLDVSAEHATCSEQKLDYLLCFITLLNTLWHWIAAPCWNPRQTNFTVALGRRIWKVQRNWDLSGIHLTYKSCLIRHSLRAAGDWQPLQQIRSVKIRAWLGSPALTAALCATKKWITILNTLLLGPYAFSSLPCNPEEGLNNVEGFKLAIRKKSPHKLILGPAEPFS